ncbi:transcription antitermination factor NusB [Rubinisphaera margarita]|uniref:transcription antitermination factor NusB n=1 Tax=Rubinisphaera margarita TaxID=2909586 RepID=UPI001EE7DD80|nr:transcription antitermination factor NusB [Rubinisphaera margarita]MCG6155460.1 transcription antitermination factor NusB [Rubinisphaera margarita]
MSKRSKARELALQMLFLVDMNPDVDGKTVLEMIQERIEDQEASRFSWQLFSGTMERRDQIDAAISAVAKNWTLKRMAATDRNLLRLGCFELQHFDTPPTVVINEAIDLAKKFGAENSSSFVNGILDQLKPRE